MQRMLDNLIEQVLVNAVSLALCRMLHDQEKFIVHAALSDLYIHEPGQALPRRVGNLSLFDAPAASDISRESQQLAAQAMQQQAPVEKTLAQDHRLLAIPLSYEATSSSDTLAVLVVYLQTSAEHDQRELAAILSRLIGYIFSASTAHHLQTLSGQGSQRFPSQTKTIDDVMDHIGIMVCERLGFHYAAIHLCDDATQALAVASTYHVPEQWQAITHHPRTGQDLRHMVLESQNVVAMSESDESGAPPGWQEDESADLLRIWVPLGQVGVLEAGLLRKDDHTPTSLAVAVLQHTARDCTIDIQHAKLALLYEREQRYVRVLHTLHTISQTLQVSAHEMSEQRLFTSIAETALDVLNASVVALYPFDDDEQHSTEPIIAGGIVGTQPLTHPNDHHTIVHHIAQERHPYYEPNAQQSDVLVYASAMTYTSKKHRTPPRRTFTSRQKIVSFAGVPLIARGTLLGVLCLNYRTPCLFEERYRQVIELFAQHAAAAIVSSRTLQYKEKLQHQRFQQTLAHKLHDTVKNSVRALIHFSRVASLNLTRNPDKAQEYLHEIRRGGWSILSDVDLLLNDMVDGDLDSQKLEELIRKNTAQVLGGLQDELLSISVPQPLPHLSPPIIRTLLYLIREAVMNACEHSAATIIQVQVLADDVWLKLTVEDNGKGMPYRSLDAIPPTHHGLQFMRERTIELGGHIELTSQPGQGTRLMFDLPQQLISSTSI